MRRTKMQVAPQAPRTVLEYLDALQDHQRAARADLEAARLRLNAAVASLGAADEVLVRTAELLGLPVEA